MSSYTTSPGYLLATSLALSSICPQYWVYRPVSLISPYTTYATTFWPGPLAEDSSPHSELTSGDRSDAG